MNEKLLSYLSIISIIAETLIEPITNANKFKYLTKKIILNVFIVTIIGIVFLFFTWALILLTIYFYLLTIPLSYLQAFIITIGINLIAIICLLIWVFKINNQIKELQSNSFTILIFCLVTIIKKLTKQKTPKIKPVTD